MLTYADLVLNGSLIYDYLDKGTLDAYTQVGTATLTLSPAATQESVGAYDQNLTVELVFDADGLQEFVAPSTAVAYLQSSNAQLISYAGADQEHVPIAGGQFGQSGNITLFFVHLTTQEYLDADLQNADVYITFTFDSAQEQITAGGAIAEQDGSVSLFFQGNVLHDWEDPYSGPQGYTLVASVVGIVEGMTAFPMSISPPLPTAPEYFYMKFISAATEWLTNRGLGGEPVGAEILLNGSPFISVTPEQDYVIVEPHVQPAFTALYDALIAGEADFKLRGFERFGEYTLSQPLRGESALRMRAYY